MRKGTKKIRHVNTGTGDYYVYDLDEDAFGKRKRLYGKTEAELKEKIEQAEKERELILASQRPKGKKLSDCVRYYFKSSIGKINASDIKRLLTLFDNTVKNSGIDKDIDELTADDIQQFLDKSSEVYHRQSVMELRGHLQKVFELFEQDIDFGDITIDDEAQPASCVISPSEYEEVIKYCLMDNCTKCGQNERLFLFSLFTGLPFSKVKKLNQSDLNFDDRTFTIDGMVYPLSERACAWLQEQILAGTLNSKPLFINGNNVSPSLQSIQTTVDAITKHLGLPKGLTSKTITKSYIVWRIQNGATTDELTKYFGFKDKFKVQNIYDEYKVRTELYR